MSRFEFIFVLVSIIVGLALAKLLTGLTQALRKSKGEVDFAHVTFSFATIFLLITIWWATFRWEDHAAWTFAEFFLLCAYTSVFYVKSEILFPSNASIIPKFDEVRLPFYVALIAYSVIEVLVIYLRDGTLSPWYYLPMIVHLVVLAGIGVIVRNTLFDRIFAGWYLAINLSWPFLALLSG